MPASSGSLESPLVNSAELNRVPRRSLAMRVSISPVTTSPVARFRILFTSRFNSPADIDRSASGKPCTINPTMTRGSINILSNTRPSTGRIAQIAV